jgi:hypothetical protein
VHYRDLRSPLEGEPSAVIRERVIRMESKGKNQGSIFTFSLPLVFGEPGTKA